MEQVQMDSQWMEQVICRTLEAKYPIYLKDIPAMGIKKDCPLHEVDEIWGKSITKNKNGKPL